MCFCGCGVMKCECIFIGMWMCMLLSLREHRMLITRDFYHGKSLLVSTCIWHGVSLTCQIGGVQRMCKLQRIDRQCLFIPWTKTWKQKWTYTETEWGVGEGPTIGFRRKGDTIYTVLIASRPLSIVSRLLSSVYDLYLSLSICHYLCLSILCELIFYQM